MKRVSLTQSQFAIVDNWNYRWLSKYKWYALWNKNTKSFYAVRNSRYKDNKERFHIFMHKEILDLRRGNKRQGDHRNHNTLDNREANLRIVTNMQNSFNRRGIKGYTWNNRNCKYQVRITANKHTFSLGYFDNPEEAHQVYLRAKKKYHQI